MGVVLEFCPVFSRTRERRGAPALWQCRRQAGIDRRSARARHRGNVCASREDARAALHCQIRAPPARAKCPPEPERSSDAGGLSTGGAGGSSRHSAATQRRHAAAGGATQALADNLTATLWGPALRAGCQRG